MTLFGPERLIFKCNSFFFLAQLQFHNKSLTATDTYLGNNAARRCNISALMKTRCARSSGRNSAALSALWSRLLLTWTCSLLHMFGSVGQDVTPPLALLGSDRQTDAPPSWSSLSQSVLPAPPQHLHRVTHLTPPHPSQPESTRSSANRRTGAARQSGHCAALRCARARADGREEPQQRRTRWEWLTRIWWVPLLDSLFFG